jgi:hypothetical protein
MSETDLCSLPPVRPTPAIEEVAAIIAGFRFGADDVRRAGPATLRTWIAAMKKARAILVLFNGETGNSGMNPLPVPNLESDHG